MVDDGAGASFAAFQMFSFSNFAADGGLTFAGDQLGGGAGSLVFAPILLADGTLVVA